MGRIIGASEGLINPAFDKFLDGNPTRREMQAAFNKMGNNDAELFSMVDTQALVGNFLCEKLGVTREEIAAYIAKKAEQLKTMREAAEKAIKQGKESSVDGADLGKGTSTVPVDTNPAGKMAGSNE